MTNYRVDASFPASKPVNLPMDRVEVEHEYTLDEILGFPGGGDTEGTTDTDAETHGNYGKGSGYTKIYRKY